MLTNAKCQTLYFDGAPFTLPDSRPGAGTLAISGGLIVMGDAPEDGMTGAVGWRRGIGPIADALGWRRCIGRVEGVREQYRADFWIGPVVYLARGWLHVDAALALRALLDEHQGSRLVLGLEFDKSAARLVERFTLRFETPRGLGAARSSSA